MYQRLLLQHRLLRLPHLFHNRLHFCHILFINIPDTVNSFCNLIQIPTNLSKCFISIALDKNNLHHKQIQRVLVSGCNLPLRQFHLPVQDIFFIIAQINFQFIFPRSVCPILCPILCHIVPSFQIILRFREFSLNDKFEHFFCRRNHSFYRL